MRIWLAALAFLLIAGEASAQTGLVPLEPFILTTPEYPTYGQDTGNCANVPSAPNRDRRRGQEVNPGWNAERQRSNPGCPAN